MHLLLSQVNGLHDNANISKDITQTQELLDTLILTGGARVEGGSGMAVLQLGNS